MSGRWACLGILLAACATVLTACNSAPPKPDKPETTGKIEPQAPRQHRSTPRRSPYAPAQEDLGKRGNYTSGGLYAPHIPDSVPEGGIADVDLIPEPEVTDEPRSRYGNRSPYTVLGKSYRVLESAEGYDETGIASYYGNKFHGRRTSALEVYDMYAFTAAHKTLPLPSFARVTNLSNGKSVIVRVNDRGPFHDGRIIDLSYAAAVKLGVDRAGTARVEVKGLSPGENAREPYDAVAAAANARKPVELSPGIHIATGKPAPPSAMDKLVGALPIATANAGERPPQVVTAMATIPPATAATTPVDTGWRFDMSQDGRTMTVDEFDVWMRARQARVATGKPRTPQPRQAEGIGAGAMMVDATAPMAVAERTIPVASASMVLPPLQNPATGVTLQVASFAARDNAERALAMLTGAGVAGARLQDADADGRHVWRLRVGPVATTSETELAARIRGLGFGQPQRVHE